MHGLYVKEAITYTDQSISEARARGDKEVRLIVGLYQGCVPGKPTILTVS